MSCGKQPSNSCSWILVIKHDLIIIYIVQCIFGDGHRGWFWFYWFLTKPMCRVGTDGSATKKEGGDGNDPSQIVDVGVVDRSDGGCCIF